MFFSSLDYPRLEGSAQTYQSDAAPIWKNKDEKVDAVFLFSICFERQLFERALMPRPCSLGRTARQYRRISGQMKAAVVGRTQQCHLRSVSTVLAGMPGSSGKHRGSDYVHHERYSYLQEAKQIFSAGDSISLTIDGVQLGDPILNLIAWDCKTKQGFICPPQAWAFFFGQELRMFFN